jgi:hypothetical protein
LTVLTEQRRDQFKAEVEQVKVKGDSAASDGRTRAIGLLLMVVGVVGAFLAYNVSLSQSDLRDTGSSQVLASAFVALTVVGAAVYLAASVARVLRLWLLRQLMDGQAQADQITAALAERRI